MTLRYCSQSDLPCAMWAVLFFNVELRTLQKKLAHAIDGSETRIPVVELVTWAFECFAELISGLGAEGEGKRIVDDLHFQSFWPGAFRLLSLLQSGLHF